MIDTIQIQLLLVTFGAWVNRQQGGVIAYLIEENRVLEEQLKSGGKRLRFTDDQRRRLAAKGKPLGLRALRHMELVAQSAVSKGKALSESRFRAGQV